VTSTVDSAKIDQRTAQWLRKRHPDWPDERISNLIIRTRIIDDHPNWTDAEIDSLAMALQKRDTRAKQSETEEP
jgi:hypothetical protein